LPCTDKIIEKILKFHTSGINKLAEKVIIDESAMKHISRAITVFIFFLFIAGEIKQLQAQSMTGRWKGAIRVNYGFP